MIANCKNFTRKFWFKSFLMSIYSRVKNKYIFFRESKNKPLTQLKINKTFEFLHNINTF